MVIAKLTLVRTMVYCVAIKNNHMKIHALLWDSHSTVFSWKSRSNTVFIGSSFLHGVTCLCVEVHCMVILIEYSRDA